jgi:hypothetical protein
MDTTGTVLPQCTPTDFPLSLPFYLPSHMAMGINQQVSVLILHELDKYKCLCGTLESSTVPVHTKLARHNSEGKNYTMIQTVKLKVRSKYCDAFALC